MFTLSWLDTEEPGSLLERQLQPRYFAEFGRHTHLENPQILFVGPDRGRVGVASAVGWRHPETPRIWLGDIQQRLCLNCSKSSESGPGPNSFEELPPDWESPHVDGENFTGLPGLLVGDEVVPATDCRHDLGHCIGRGASPMPLFQRSQFRGKWVVAKNIAYPAREVASP